MKENNIPEIITFGCRLNIYESEVIRNNLRASGLKDVCVINTCTVTAQAEREAKQTIRKIKKKSNESESEGQQNRGKWGPGVFPRGNKT